MDETLGFTVTLTDQVTGVARTVEASITGMAAKIVRSGEQITKSQEKAASSLANTGSVAQNALSATSRTLSAASLAAAEVGSKFGWIATNIRDLFVSIGGSAIKSAMETEQADARLAFSMARLGKNLTEATAEIDNIALKTSLTRNEVAGLVDELAFQGVDALTKNLADLTVTMANGVKQPISALEVLNDAVVFSGKNTKRILFSMKEAISEGKIRPGKQLADDLNLTKKDLEAWNAALAKSANSQEAFEALIRLTAERVGGVTASLGQTLYFASKQIDDWVNKITKDTFGKALPVFSEFLMTVNETVIQLVNSDAFKGIRQSVTYIAEGFTTIGKLALPVIQGALGILAAFPAILPALTALLTFVAGISGLAAVVTAISGVFFAIGGIAALLPTILVGLKIMFVLMTGIAVAAAVVLTPLIAIAATLTTMFAKYLGANSFLDFWEKLKLAISAVLEGIRNMRGELTSLSEGTAKRLEKAGILQQVTDLLGMVHRVTAGFDEFKTTIKESFDLLANSGKAKLIENMMKSIGGDLGIGSFSMSNNMEGAKSTGGYIAQVVVGFADGLLTTTAILGLFATGLIRIIKLVDKVTPGTGLLAEAQTAQLMQAARGGEGESILNAMTLEQRSEFLHEGIVPGMDPRIKRPDTFMERMFGGNYKQDIKYITPERRASDPWLDEVMAMRERMLSSEAGNLNKPVESINILKSLSRVDAAKLDVMTRQSQQGVLDPRVYDKITKELGPAVAKALQGVVMKMKFDPNTPISTIVEMQADLVMEGM